jgi:hypothetical protein
MEQLSLRTNGRRHGPRRLRPARLRQYEHTFLLPPASTHSSPGGGAAREAPAGRRRRAMRLFQDPSDEREEARRGLRQAAIEYATSPPMSMTREEDAHCIAERTSPGRPQLLHGTAYEFEEEARCGDACTSLLASSSPMSGWARLRTVGGVLRGGRCQGRCSRLPRRARLGGVPDDVTGVAASG